MNSLEDLETLIERMSAGDQSAFDGLYTATSAKLFGIVLRVLGNRAEAEDALQEAYIKIWRNADRYQANGLSPMTWLITIARNTAIDKLRAKRRATETMDEAVEVADPTAGPEEQAIAASESSRIAHCMSQLDPAKAGAVRRAYLAGESYKELASHYQVPLNTIRTWLRRGLLKLRECLADG